MCAAHRHALAKLRSRLLTFFLSFKKFLVSGQKRVSHETLQCLYSTKSPGPDLSPLRSKAEQTCPPLTCSELHKCSYFSDETKPNLKCKPVHTSQFPQEKKNTVYTPLLGLPRACPAPQAHHWFSCSSVPARRQHSGCTEEAARAMAPSFLNVSTARGKASC